jgi:hypothetical protein
VLDTGFHIEEDLRQLAEYRSGVLAKGDDEAVIGKRVGEAGAHTVILESEASSGADKGAERGLAEEVRGMEAEVRGMVAEMGQMLQQSKQAPKQGTNIIKNYGFNRKCMVSA